LAVAAAGMCCQAASDGMFSKAQTDRGEGLYQMNCAACHGNELEGGEHAPPLRDEAFWEEWNGKAARALYSRILTTMPPTDPGSVSEKDTIDIVAKIARFNGIPEGVKTIQHADELNALMLRQPK
jgi:cytochrome c5